MGKSFGSVFTLYMHVCMYIHMSTHVIYHLKILENEETVQQNNKWSSRKLWEAVWIIRTVFNSQGFADKSVKDSFAYHAVSVFWSRWYHCWWGCRSMVTGIVWLWMGELPLEAGWVLCRGKHAQFFTNRLTSECVKRKTGWSACDLTWRDLHPRPLRKKMGLRKYS